MAELTPLKFEKNPDLWENLELDDIFLDENNQAVTELLARWDEAKSSLVSDDKGYNRLKEQRRELLAKIARIKRHTGNKSHKERTELSSLEGTAKELEDKMLLMDKNLEKADENKHGNIDTISLLRNSSKEQIMADREIYAQVRNNDNLKNSFQFLRSLRDKMRDSDAWNQETSNCNISTLSYKDDKLMLRVKNLGDTGLSFALDEKMSLIFTENETLDNKQIDALSCYFYDMGLDVKNFSSVQNLKVNTGNDEISFEEAFKSHSPEAHLEKTLQQIQAEIQKLELNGEYVPKGLLYALDIKKIQEEFGENNKENQYSVDGSTGNSGGTVNGAANDSHADAKLPFDEYIKGDKIDISLKKMKDGIIARAGIMRTDKRCIKQRRMPDGSYVISLYASESDKLNDGKLDKDGVPMNKKRVSFRLYTNRRPATVGIYVPQGAKFETSFAKGALKALKNCGYKYFVMPNAVEFGGDAQGAFWEAAGDQLMCPRLKRYKDDPNGCDIGNDHLAKLLKAIEDKSDGKAEDIIEYKMRLVRELRAYCKHTPNTHLENTCSKLEGDCKFYRYNNETKPFINKFINDGIDGKYVDENGNNRKWNQIDVACAYEATARLLQGLDKGYFEDAKGNRQDFPKGFDILNGGNKEFVEKFLQEQMAACREEVIKTYEDKIRIGGVDIDAGSDDNDEKQANKYKTASNETLEAYKKRMDDAAKDCAECGSDQAKDLSIKISARAIDAAPRDISKASKKPNMPRRDNGGR